MPKDNSLVERVLQALDFQKSEPDRSTIDFLRGLLSEPERRQLSMQARYRSAWVAKVARHIAAA